MKSPQSFGSSRSVGDYERKHLYYCDRAGYIRDNPDFVVDRQHLDNYLLLYVESGLFHTDIAGCRQTVCPGETVIINLKKPHRYYSDQQDPCAIYWMDYNCTDDKMGLLTALTALPLICRCQNHDQMMRDFVHNYVNNSQFDSLQQSILIYRLLASAAAAAGHGDDDRPVPHTGWFDIESYISTHLHCRISLAQLADIFHVSVCHFCHLFKAQYGMPPMQYIIQRRLDRAVYLLTYSNLNIGEIAEQLAFSSQSHFSSLFYRHVGAYPTAFRQKRLQALRQDQR